MTEGRLLGAAVVAFAALLGAAMVCYPGGDYFHAEGTHYRFWHNFLCDLLLAESLNGQANVVGSVLATLSAFVMMMFGLLPVWWRARTWRVATRASGVLSTVFAMLMCVQVSFDLPLPHAVITLLFGGFAVVASIPVVIDLRRPPATPVAVAWTGVLASAAAIGGAVLYGLTKWGGLSASPLLPAVQKVVLILTVGWLGMLARHLCARDRRP